MPAEKTPNNQHGGTEETVARQGAELRSLAHSVDQLRLVVESERSERKRDFDLIRQEIHNVSLGQQTLASRSGSIDSRTMLTFVAVCLTAFFGSIGVSGTIFGKFREADIKALNETTANTKELFGVKFNTVDREFTAMRAAVAELDTKLQIEDKQALASIDSLRAELETGYKAAARDNAMAIGNMRERVASMEQLLSFLREGWRELKDGQGNISATLFEMQRGDDAAG